MLRTMSTSSVASIVYEHRASTSEGSMPASAQASTITVQASSVSVGSRCLANAVWAMPAMAVASWKPTAGLIALSSLIGPGAFPHRARTSCRTVAADLTTCQIPGTIGAHGRHAFAWHQAREPALHRRQMGGGLGGHLRRG